MRHNKRGSAMLEVLVIGMAVMILTSVMYLYAGIEYRYALGKAEKEEAYYAAMSAVRLMEREVTEGEYAEGTAAYALTKGSGLKKYETELVFEADHTEGEVKIPVTVWSEVAGNELYLAAEAGVGDKRTVVKLRMLKTEENIDAIVENESVTATDSNAAPAANVRWTPVAYENGL